jgi:DNA-binding GntR family transcriptional regulator
LAASTTMLRTDVYDQLKERMFTGELRTGQFVSQRELTSLLGATLNPVREAIRQLEIEGLINVYPQRGIQIIEGGPKAINDAYDYRLLLELNAVRQFTAAASEKAIAELMANVRKAIRALEASPNDIEVRRRVLDDDHNFHKDLVDFQQNDILSKHYSLNAARLWLFRINMGQPLLRLSEAANEHLEILEACRKRDTATAIDLLTRHIEISREHALGIRPMQRIIDNKMVTTTPTAQRKSVARKRPKTAS